MSDKTTTFVTVVFEPEFDLLRLQARSLATYLPPDLVNRILVVDNTRRGLSHALRNEVLTDYGGLRRIVQFIRPDSFISIPRTTGWYAQQIVKLAISAHVETPTYIVLDAKNHLVRPLRQADLVDESGRLRSYMYSFEAHPLRAGLERTLDWFGLVGPQYVQRFMPAVTPYPLVTSVVRELVLDFETRVGLPFPRAFLRADLLEFFSYAAFASTRAGGTDELYSFDGAVPVAVWPGAASADQLRGALEKASVATSPWFAVHRRAFARMDAPGIESLSRFWADRGLADPVESAELVRRMIDGVNADDRVHRRQDLGVRVRRAVRRRLRSLKGSNRV